MKIDQLIEELERYHDLSYRTRPFLDTATGTHPRRRIKSMTGHDCESDGLRGCVKKLRGCVKKDIGAVLLDVGYCAVVNLWPSEGDTPMNASVAVVSAQTQYG